MLKSIEMKQVLKEMKQKAEVLLGNKEATISEIQASNNEIEIMQAKITMQENLENTEKEEIENSEIEAGTRGTAKNEIKDFINGIRTKFQNALSGTTGIDGGVLVPQDILTEINELRQSKDALQNLITVEPVSTLSGSRVYKTRSQQTGFALVAEGGIIAEKATPKFTELAYVIKKYAGFLKVVNEILKDSDQAIKRMIVRWIGDESRVTRNKLILAELNLKAKTAIATVDDIKDTLNVTLDAAFRNSAIILTNQDGFNHLDKLKDIDGRYLLESSITASSGKQLLGRPIEVVSNQDFPSVNTAGVITAPLIIGDLKESIVMFDRENLSIKASDVAGDAYLTDMTLFRVIERQEVKTKDAEAFVYGELTI